MRVERRDAEAEQNLVVLIADLLKLVHASFPKRRELDFDPATADEPIRAAAGDARHIKILCGKKAGNELLANLSPAARGVQFDPCERA